MTDKDAFAEREHNLEEEYFRRKEKELIEKLRSNAQAEAERRRLGQEAGLADEELLRDLQDLGYRPETVMLLFLVPLIQTAWAERKVSEKERNAIVKAARARGIAAGSPADALLNQWLKDRPSDATFDRTLRIIRAILQGRSPEERAASERDLLSLCTAIASASGGLVGFGAVSEEERRTLAHIAEILEPGSKR